MDNDTALKIIVSSAKFRLRQRVEEAATKATPPTHLSVTDDEVLIIKSVKPKIKRK
jgi:hypothetical protein